MRASRVEHGQSTPFWDAFRLCSHWGVSCGSVSLSGSLRARQCLVRPRSAIAALWSQRPCLGGGWSSQRAASLRACAGGKTSEREPSPGGLRFSHPSRRLAASGERTSRRSLILLGPVPRGPGRCDTHRPRALERLRAHEGAVPCRSYSSSNFSGCPGAAGRGCRSPRCTARVVQPCLPWGPVEQTAAGRLPRPLPYAPHSRPWARAACPPLSAEAAAPHVCVRLSDRLMAERLDPVSGHRLVCQEPPGPAGLPCGWLTAPERDPAGLALTSQARRSGGARLLLPVASGLKPWFDQTVSDPKNGLETDRTACGALCICPGRPLRIGFQQPLGLPHLGGCSGPLPG